MAPIDCWNWGEWGLKEDKWKGSFLFGSFGLSCQYKRFLFYIGCSRRPSTKYFFPHRTPVTPLQYFNYSTLSPSPSKLGRQPCWVACLLVSVSLFATHWTSATKHIPPPPKKKYTLHNTLIPLNHDSASSEFGELCALAFNDFNNLAFPGRWGLLNLILRHLKIRFSFFLPFFPRLTFKNYFS